MKKAFAVVVAFMMLACFASCAAKKTEPVQEPMGAASLTELREAVFAYIENGCDYSYISDCCILGGEPDGGFLSDDVRRSIEDLKYPDDYYFGEIDALGETPDESRPGTYLLNLTVYGFKTLDMRYCIKEGRYFLCDLEMVDF